MRLTNQDYLTLSADIANVLCNGHAGKLLASIQEPWEASEPWEGEPQTPCEPPALPEVAEALPATAQGFSIFDEDFTPPEENLGQWIDRRQREARAPYQPWSEIIARVKAGEWARQADLALAFNKPIRWAARLRKVAVAQGEMTEAAWRASFKKKTTKYDPQLTSRRSLSSGTPQLEREQFEKIMLEKQDCFTFDFFLQLLRLRCWATVEEFGTTLPPDPGMDCGASHALAAGAHVYRRDVEGLFPKAGALA